MIAVIFEVSMQANKLESYLELAADLHETLIKIPGFISIDRFRNLKDPEKLLSLSFWKDEEAVKQWRNLPSHREAQEAGRKGIFTDYRLHIAEVLRDYGMFDRGEAPQDSLAAHNQFNHKSRE